MVELTPGTPPVRRASRGRQVERFMRRHKITTGIGAFALLGALGNLGSGGTTDPSTHTTASQKLVTHAAASPTRTPESTATSAPAATKAAPPVKAAPASKPAPTVVQAGVAGPDSRLTPGSILAASTTARVCTSGYSASVRNVTTATRQQVFAAYGIAYPPAAGAYELDHRIPLELGGDNAATNLWPEPYHTGVGSADVKDHLENHLHALVCSGQVSLAAAQHAMAGDWWAAAAKYNPMSVRTVTVTKPTPAAPALTPKATRPASNDQGTVHPGSFCAPSGASGRTTAGTAMVCGTTANSPSRGRWHKA